MLNKVLFVVPRFIILKLLILLIKGYQYFISPYLGSNCRFTPSCSSYGLQSLKVHGVIKGSALTVKRIIKCNPWGSQGFDPVPEKIKHKKGY